MHPTSSDKGQICLFLLFQPTYDTQYWLICGKREVCITQFQVLADSRQVFREILCFSWVGTLTRWTLAAYLARGVSNRSLLGACHAGRVQTGYTTLSRHLRTLWYKDNFWNAQNRWRDKDLRRSSCAVVLSKKHMSWACKVIPGCASCPDLASICILEGTLFKSTNKD